MKSSNNYIDNSSDKLLDSDSYGKSDIEVRRKGMRRENPMCKVTIQSPVCRGPDGNEKWAFGGIENRNENEK
jgi:hypothetical protein